MYSGLPVLNVVVSGKADVEIVVQTHGTNLGAGYTHYYRETETYLNAVIPLLGKTNLSGRLVFPFDCPLPTDHLPCTFGNIYGAISYKVTAHWGTFTENDIRKEVPFIVAPFLDLNRTSLLGYIEPSLNTDAVDVGGGCFSSGKITKLEVYFPKRYFIPGEFIRFTVIIKNGNDGWVRNSTMKLVLDTASSAEGMDRSNETTLEEMYGPDVKPKSEAVWEVNDFMVPVTQHPYGVIPTGLGGGCGLFRANYYLRVTL